MGILIIRALLFGLHDRAPHFFWKLAECAWSLVTSWPQVVEEMRRKEENHVAVQASTCESWSKLPIGGSFKGS